MKYQKLVLAMAIVAVSQLAACSSNDGSASTERVSSGSMDRMSNAQTSRVDRAVTAAKAVRANPNDAERVLRDQGMTEQQFEDLMYEIAADPEMSAAYNARVGQ